MQTADSKKWAVPIFVVAMGVVYLVAFWAGGEVGAGVGAAVFMVVVAVLLLFGGRSEVVRVLRGQPTDEMWRSFNLGRSGSPARYWPWSALSSTR
jgi:hypothetical protein